MTNPQVSFTDQEKDAVRRGVFAASALVSYAEPGFFDSFKEAFSASKALAQAPAELRDVLQGGLVMPPKATSAEDLDRQMVDQAHEAMRIADAKGPQVGGSVRALIQHVAQAAAQASKGVSPAEQAAIDKIMTASQPISDEGPARAAVDPNAPQQPAAPTQWEQPNVGQSRPSAERPEA